MTPVGRRTNPGGAIFGKPYSPKTSTEAFGETDHMRGNTRVFAAQTIIILGTRTKKGSREYRVASVRGEDMKLRLRHGANLNRELVKRLFVGNPLCYEVALAQALKMESGVRKTNITSGSDRHGGIKVLHHDEPFPS